MVDLKSQVEVDAERLKHAWVAATQSASIPGIILPRKCYERWSEKASLYRSLEGTVKLFLARDESWNNVTGILSQGNIVDANPNLVKYGQHMIDFSVARHLALTSYVSITWSIYDRLANVCGRLSAVVDVTDNPKNNPKVCEDFLSWGKKSDMLAFGTQFFLIQSYAWPLKVSYKIRNWLVHEGYEEGCIPLFKSDWIADKFILHDDSSNRLEKVCGFNKDSAGKIENCCLGEHEECWPSKDLLVILEKYNYEIDMMFAGLLEWSVNAFTMQFRTFVKRDMHVLRTATIVESVF